jgi:hypothetical protein
VLQQQHDHFCMTMTFVSSCKEMAILAIFDCFEDGLRQYDGGIISSFEEGADGLAGPN